MPREDPWLSPRLLSELKPTTVFPGPQIQPTQDGCAWHVSTEVAAVHQLPRNALSHTREHTPLPMLTLIQFATHTHSH